MDSPARKLIMRTRTNSISWNPMEPMNFTAVLLMVFAGSYNHSIIQNSFGNSLSCCFGFESLSLDLAPGGVGCVFIEWLQHADVKDGMELAAPPMRRINFVSHLAYLLHYSQGSLIFLQKTSLFPLEICDPVAVA
ncbi:hypothetical protein RJ639_002683 [Escallonia herrerae]|uniref:Uncharacterized protein n=1 Tax=Escallonia herrerae TaxID=1293975 RepID=A0AA89BTL8_9ASTE|nr:hypothetical protein RJ639_002683 [Escallonia herrerae]